MSALILCLSHLATKILGLDRTVNVFRWAGQISRPQPAPDYAAHGIAERAVKGMQFLPLRVECLDQAIATWFALNRNSIPAVLNIGMRLSPLSGHAWVTCKEQTFVQTPGLEDFTVVASYAPWSATG
jgi:hypothetical protein